MTLKTCRLASGNAPLKRDSTNNSFIRFARPENPAQTLILLAPFEREKDQGGGP